LEKHVDAGENLRAQKTEAMPRTLTIVLMTNPSRGSTFYFRRKDGEYFDRTFDRCRDILTWTHYDEIKCENVSHFAGVHTLWVSCTDANGNFGRAGEMVTVANCSKPFDLSG
jgi:hypothetical protein